MTTEATDSELGDVAGGLVEVLDEGDSGLRQRVRPRAGKGRGRRAVEDLKRQADEARLARALKAERSVVEDSVLEDLETGERAETLFSTFPLSVETGMPVVKGEVLDPVQWECFRLWAMTGGAPGGLVQSLKKRGYKVNGITVKIWQCSAWWAELVQVFLKRGQETLFEGLTRRVPAILEAVDGILAGDESYQKFGNAIIQLQRMYSEMGPTPLISKGSGMVVNNSVVNLTRIDASVFKKLSPEELARLAKPDLLQPGKYGGRKHK